MLDEIFKIVYVDTLQCCSSSCWDARMLQCKHQIPCRSCLASQNSRYTWVRNESNEIKSLNIPHHFWTYKKIKTKPFFPPLRRQQRLVSEIGFTSLRWYKLTINQSPETAQLHRSTLISSKNPPGTCQSVKVTRMLNEYPSMKRNKIAPAKGKEAAIYGGRLHTVQSARSAVLHPAANEGGGVWQSRSTWHSPYLGSTPTLAGTASLLAQKSQKILWKHPSCLK